MNEEPSNSLFTEQPNDIKPRNFQINDMLIYRAKCTNQTTKTICDRFKQMSKASI